MKMTTEEAFIKVLQMHGIEHAFGIIGSAMMPISDLFPAAGIKFWDCAHEVNAGMSADGYTRATGKMSMAIAQNGPGITNIVTPIITAYWNHTPLLLVTPQAANKTIGQGGFQEIKQMAMFEDCVCYQEEVRDPSRIAEVLNRVIEKAWRGSAPAQINVPRDYWTQVIDIDLPQVVKMNIPAAIRMPFAGCDNPVGGQVPGHPERRRRRPLGCHRCLASAGREAGCPGVLQLSAQRCLPRLASACRSGRSATTARRPPWN